MAGGKGKIHEHPKANTNGLDKNPQNINRNGRPKKVYNACIEEQKAKGYEAPTRDEFYEMVGLLFVMDEDDLAEFSANKDNPQAIRRIAIDLESDKFRSKLHSEYRDWLFGKATQKVVTEDDEGNTQPVGAHFLGKQLLEELKKKGI